MIEFLGTYFSELFPLENPIAIFLAVLLIILLAPMLMRRLHIPHIVGMILAGLLMGPYALNILPFDRSFDVFGKVGLFYIMFLAGLEIDLANLKKNMSKSIVFGLVSFALPMALGLATSTWLLHFGWTTALLLASMYASHTPVSFPIISRYGLSNRSAVNIAVGGTVVTVSLAMFILAGVDCYYQEADSASLWLGMAIKMLFALGIIFYVFPKLSRWFLKFYKDGILRFAFVLALAFLGAILTDFAGFQGVLGAFFTGLALNRQLPKLSSLMNRIEFVGNALFFPYFLISIGMMIDMRAFIQGWEGIFVSLVMVGTVLLGKWGAAKLTQAMYSMRSCEGQVLFGLTSGRAAVTLAVVMIGHEIIIGYTEQGEAIRLLNEYVFNGSVVMILISCLISSIATEQAARTMLLEGNDSMLSTHLASRLLIPVSNPKVIEHLVQLSVYIKDNQDELYALSVVEDNREADQKHSRNLLDMTAQYAASVETDFHQIMRFDADVATGIAHSIREYHISDVLLGLHRSTHWDDQGFEEKIRHITDSIHCNLFISRFDVSPSSLRRIVVFVPEKAEYELGFSSLVKRVYLLSRNIGCRIVLYGHPTTIQHVNRLREKANQPIHIEFNELHNWQNIPMLVDNVQDNHLALFVLSRKGGVSYSPLFEDLPKVMDKVFAGRSLCFFYPEHEQFVQNITSYSGPVDMPSFENEDTSFHFNYAQQHESVER